MKGKWILKRINQAFPSLSHIPKIQGAMSPTLEKSCVTTKPHYLKSIVTNKEIWKSEDGVTQIGRRKETVLLMSQVIIQFVLK